MDISSPIPFCLGASNPDAMTVFLKRPCQQRLLSTQRNIKCWREILKALPYRITSLMIDTEEAETSANGDLRNAAATQASAVVVSISALVGPDSWKSAFV